MKYLLLILLIFSACDIYIPEDNNNSPGWDIEEKRVTGCIVIDDNPNDSYAEMVCRPGGNRYRIRIVPQQSATPLDEHCFITINSDRSTTITCSNGAITIPDMSRCECVR